MTLSSYFSSHEYLDKIWSFKLTFEVWGAEVCEFEFICVHSSITEPLHCRANGNRFLLSGHWLLIGDDFPGAPVTDVAVSWLDERLLMVSICKQRYDIDESARRGREGGRQEKPCDSSECVERKIAQ